MNELTKRILIAVIFIPVLLAALYFGGLFLIILFALASMFCQYEYIKMLRNADVHIRWHWLALAVLTYFAMVLFKDLDTVILMGLFLIAILEAVFLWDRDKSFPRAAFALFGVVYTVFLPVMCVRLGLDKQQPKLLLWLVVLIWATDSVAYLIGSKWGKHRNVFALSSNKSWEGFLAGAVAPFLIMIILYYAQVFDDLLLCLLMAFAAGFIGQLGDLAESMLKRYSGVKDSSKLIPGHGGILDRTDSILLAGSFVYFALFILNKVR